MPKHFIAALGASCYNNCNYKLRDKTITTNFVQEAILKNLEFGQGDKVTILLTEYARTRNWEESTYSSKDIADLKRHAMDGEKLPSEGEKKEGLHSILQRKFKNICVNDVDILDGKSEQEVWKTFEIVYKQIGENDTIYFDITNGFRSLPMLAMTILSYGKVLKNIEIKGIYYGALDAKDKRTGIVPIFDLTACNDILNWTVAANNFVNYGNSNYIGELCKKSSDSEFTKAWKQKLNKVVNLTNCIETSRGMELESVSNKSNSIKNAYNEFENSPLKVKNSAGVEKIVMPLYEKIEASASIFNKDSNFEIGMATVEWSLENGMIQQGFTALNESMKTFLCNQYGLNEHVYETRDLVVAPVLNAVRYCKAAMEENVDSVLKRKQILKVDKCYNDTLKSIEGDMQSVAERLAYEVPKSLAILYGNISDYRNDMNHFGYKKQPLTHDTLRKKLKECYGKFMKVAENYQYEKLK